MGRYVVKLCFLAGIQLNELLQYHILTFFLLSCKWNDVILISCGEISAKVLPVAHASLSTNGERECLGANVSGDDLMRSIMDNGDAADACDDDAFRKLPLLFSSWFYKGKRCKQSRWHCHKENASSVKVKQIEMRWKHTYSGSGAAAASWAIC